MYGEVARQVMCEAFKLEMTAVQVGFAHIIISPSLFWQAVKGLQLNYGGSIYYYLHLWNIFFLKGYVWFLPLWLRQQWYDTDYYNLLGEKVRCTTDEMMKAINGHLGLSHAYFARDDDMMQEGITVRKWRERYENACRAQNQYPSNYAGYAYDAMWTYAYAIDRLIHENQSYVFDLHSDHTVERLTQFIGETDFEGVGWASLLSIINDYWSLCDQSEYEMFACRTFFLLQSTSKLI